MALVVKPGLPPTRGQFLLLRKARGAHPMACPTASTTVAAPGADMAVKFAIMQRLSDLGLKTDIELHPQGVDILARVGEHVREGVYSLLQRIRTHITTELEITMTGTKFELKLPDAEVLRRIPFSELLQDEAKMGDIFDHCIIIDTARQVSLRRLELLFPS